MDFYNFLPEVCSVVLQEQSQPTEGPGTVVEIDESKFGATEVHVLCWRCLGFQRHRKRHKTAQVFFVIVPNRSTATLLPISQTVDFAGNYNTVWFPKSILSAWVRRLHTRQSLYFASESRTHTNTIKPIKSRWHALKKSLPKYGTNKTFYLSYFAEYCIRQKNISCATNKFLEVLQLIS